MKMGNMMQGILTVLRNKGQTNDTELSEELTNAYFGDEKAWTPDSVTPSATSNEDSPV